MHRCDNLAGSSKMTPCVAGIWPWEFDLDVKQEELGEPFIRGLQTDKKSRTVFMTNKDSKWDVYCVGEGVDPSRRPSKENPIIAVHALVIDFDTKLMESFVSTANSLKLPPCWIEQSLSGNFRCVWLFEAPVRVIDKDHGRAVLEELANVTKLRRIAPGLDDKSFEPGQMWTNGGCWLQMNGKPLPADLTTGACIKALKGLKSRDMEGGVVTDLPAMAEALAEKFPKFSEWEEVFALESQGPSFWLDDSTSPKSAIVKPWGMFTFAATAPKAAYTWAELVGKDVCDRIVSKKVSDAAGNIFYDGSKYFMRVGEHWFGYSADPISRHLRVVHGVSAVRGPDGTSQLDEVLHTAEFHGRVSAAAPCIPLEEGRVLWNGVPFLNTWRDAVVRPAADASGEWGDGFPSIAEHMDVILCHPDAPEEPQKDRFLDWLSCFYVSLLNHSPQKGQAVFLLGSAGVGKGLLSGIVDTLVGGSTRAEALLTGKTDFGGEAYNTPLMRVDDMAGLESRAAVMRFTEGIKARVANDTQPFHKKHQTQDSIPWFGRIIVTLNDDEESMSVLPDFSATVGDKIDLFHASPKFSQFSAKVMTWAERQAVIRAEAAAFGAYLVRHQKTIPEEFLDSRWGVKAYQFPLLRQEVDDSQSLGTLTDPVRDWAKHFFAHNATVPHWDGKVAELYPEMVGLKLIGSGSAYPYASAVRLGRALRRLQQETANTNRSVVAHRYVNSKRSATWRITRALAEDNE